MEKMTDAKLRKLEGIPGNTQKFIIGSGLFLQVTVNRSGKTVKSWYLRYYDAEGKRQRSKLGDYPEISLIKAIALAEEAKTTAKDGVRLSQVNAERQRIKAAQARQGQSENTFISVAESWLDKMELSWVPGHLKRQRERLQGHLYHALGNKDVSAITIADIDYAIMPLVKAGKYETARRACDLVRNVLEHADMMDMLQNSTMPAKISKYRRSLPNPVEKRHFYQGMSEDQAGKLLYALEESKYRWSRSTSVAVRLAPYVFLRASELCGAEWAEIDLNKSEWLIPAARMKSRREHLVPLSHQAVTLLREMHPFSSGNRYVFPSQNRSDKPITTNALIQVLRRLGYKSTRNEGESFVTHAFRGLASTTLYQNLQYSGEYIEHQLAHIEPNKVKLAYNKINTRSYLDKRRDMMQHYADYLDILREKARYDKK
ncbi:MAG: tyrosine-type recombinase/integrase [Desulfovibrio sp.]|nr:tyrosine-type recombinase/integrase [Desulfovibrio sp.]